MATMLVVGQIGHMPQALAGEEEEAQQEAWMVHTAETLPRDASSEDILDDEAIRAIGARSGQELLRSLSGIQLSQHGSEGKAAQFYIRGFDAAHGTDLTLSIDGMGLNEPSHIHGHGYADSGLVIPELVERIRLRKGPFGLDQGNLSTAGDIDFQLGVDEERRGQMVNVEMGWPMRARIGAYVAPRERQSDEFVGGEVVIDEGAHDNRETRRAALVAQARRGPVLFRGGVQQASFGLPGAIPLEHLRDGRAARSDAYSPETSGETAQTWLGAVLDWEGAGGEHKTSLDSRFRSFDGSENFTGNLFDADEGDTYRQVQQSLNLVIQQESRFELNEDWDLVAYAGGGVDHLNQFEENLDGLGERQDLNRGLQGRQFDGHLAVGVDGFLGDWGHLRAGIRGEAFGFDLQEYEELGGDKGRDGVGMLAPRGRLSVYLSEKWMAVASLGRGLRGPEARVFAGEQEAGADEDLRQFQGGDPVVTAIDAAEVGLVFEPTSAVELSATGFGFHASGEFVYDHVSRVQLDLGATRRLGGEVAGQFRFGDHLRLRAHMVGTHAQFVEDGRAVPFVPPLEAGALLFTQRERGAIGGVEWRAVSERALPFDAQAAGWNLFNLHGGWRWGGWELRLDLDNILDQQWEEGAYHYASNFSQDESRSPVPRVHVVPGHPRMARLQVAYHW